MSELPTSLSNHIGDLPDPRTGENIRYPLVSIITIAICAVVCGADTWVDVALFGNSKRAWFEQFLESPHGIPSHDTFGRIFRRLDAERFQQRFYEWAQHICERSQGEIVAIDGKQLRGSKDGTLGKSGIYLVNAWATENQMTLSQQKVDSKSNEITAIPELLRLLELEGAIVTIDAIGCQTNVVEVIIDQKADYIIAAKGNQGTLFEDIQTAFESASTAQLDYARSLNKGHGCIEIRECWALDDPDLLAYIHDYKTWRGLGSIVKVVSERRLPDKTEVKTCYFISSLPASAKQLLQGIRAHWQVENSLHWVLDVAFREDDSRVRKDHAPQNFSVIRQLALNLLKQETSLKVGIKAKRKQAGWDESYLLKVLCSTYPYAIALSICCQILTLPVISHIVKVWSNELGCGGGKPYSSTKCEFPLHIQV